MLVFLDLETTGFDNKKDNIIEVAAVRFDGEKIVDRYETLVQLPIDAKFSTTVQDLTGISPEMLAESGIPIAQAMKEIGDFLQDTDVITGHNISFDTGFLKENGAKINGNEIQNDEIDTFILSILLLGPDEESHSLEILTEKYGFTHDNAHRAMDDVLANLEIYKFFQAHWAQKSYSKTLFQNILEFAGKAVFPEHLFFLETEDHKQKHESENLSLSTFTEFSQHWEGENKSLQSIWENTSDNRSVFYQTPYPEQNLKNIIEHSIATHQKIILFYPSQKQQKYQEYFDALQKEFSSQDNVTKQMEWKIPSKDMIDDEKWQVFLQKESFNREESIVLFKILRAKELGTESKLKFMKEEWGVIRSLIQDGPEDSFNFTPQTSILFCPLEDKKNIQKNKSDEKRIEYFFEADDLEDTITNMYTNKVFSKRFLEDIKNRSNESNDHENNENIFSCLAKVLRKDKGENEYTVTIPFRQARFINGWNDSVRYISEYKNEDLSDDAQKTLVKIQDFFAQEEDENTIKTLELFPDNNMAIGETPIFLHEYWNEIYSEDTPQVFIGKAFPVYYGNIVMPFEIDESVEFIRDTVPLPSPIDIPNINRTATPAEGIEYLEQYIEEGHSVIFVATSKKVMENVVDSLREYSEEKGISLFSQRAGSVGKMRVNLGKEGQKILVATPRYLDNLRVEDFEFNALVMLKAPFDPPKNPLQTARRQYCQNDFDEFVIPRAVSRVLKERSRIKNLQRWFFGDGRAGQKGGWASVFVK